MSFSESMKAHRYRANLSLQELSERTGISRSVLARIESGETKRPGFTTWKKIASELDIPYERVIALYLDISERADVLKFLLAEAIAYTDRHIVRKAARKLLESTKINTFFALDYLLQVTRETEDEEIKITIYDMIIDCTKKQGIPFYQAKALLERYFIERYDFSRMEETYRRGKELLSYIEYLTVSERVNAYYRLGLQAYALKYYDDCIHLCRQGISGDSEENELMASALLAITNSYINMGDAILAELYLKKYEKSGYAKANHIRYLRAQLHAQKGEYDEAIAGLELCLSEAESETRIAIATDLLECYASIEDVEGMKGLFERESHFLPLEMNTPKKLEHVAMYMKRKGVYLLEQGMFREGMDSLFESLSHYRQIGAYSSVSECVGLIMAEHLNYGEKLSPEDMEKLSILWHSKSSLKTTQRRQMV
ncbi:helix-turn-helix transcriptional regulator [Brevibacillus composti]|uniref:Helix-turn-helix transcriptional regulator n=1 Tax=Brevibacillus composti TaxID=2796470 RepID=A0A7T5EIJ5_9BACL|nr:helix-turn-helix transcriptional regulator [Brevibacillus composti]QQE73267.1 helix-turn-helix transcriptional regulator [Brevibacillus composti]QUO40348.1 helix-turn-helix transcriptional regulator [Brevibacillus composti]